MKRKPFHQPQGRVPRIPPFYVADMEKFAVAVEKLQAVKFPQIPAPPLESIRRFHVASGLHPDYMPDTDEVIDLVLSKHAIEGAQREWERKGVKVILPTRLPMDKVRVVEQGVYRDRLDRVLVRVRHDAQWDLILSIFYRVRADSPKGLITAWVNSVSDQHYTLGKGVYERP